MEIKYKKLFIDSINISDIYLATEKIILRN